MILLVGSVKEYLVQKAKEYSDTPICITEINWSDNVDVAYTGIEEFNDKLLFLKLLDRADKIIYFPEGNSDPWDLQLNNKKSWLEFLLLLINQTNRVCNLQSQLSSNNLILENSIKFLKLVDVRKSKDPQLWTAGCSYTFGSGVDPLSSYPILLSNLLGMSLSNLAYPGSSIPWATDQILRSDIRKDDIVVWGLTSKERINWWLDDQHSNITNTSYDVYKNLEKQVSKKFLLSADNFTYQSLTHIHQVVNFCQKIQAKLLIVGLLSTVEDFLYLNNIPEYYHYYCKNSFEVLDYGSDNIHPGPLQHQDYADAIYQQLQFRNWI